jgi:DNA-binding response OmpR family regulator
VKLLFVENHQVFAETVIDQFLAGHEVVLVPTVAAARSALSHTFDAVLVDYDLPDGKGTDVIRELLAMGFRGNIVAVSSKEEGNAELRAAGAKVTCSKKDFRAIAAALAGTTR